jgi:hypothetical protein
MFLRRALFLGLSLVVCGAGVAHAGEKHALLVGCTKYVSNKNIPALRGPINDVRMWNNILTDPKGFAFPAKNVTQLAGWPDDPAQRPTYANIVKAWENLIAKAGPDVQIFILLSGHGTQQPIPASQKDPLDPKNPEPDGLDEVFLPADAGEWTGDGLANGIVDDQVGEWLDKLRDKGASVWVVFDHCHSGTMTRDVESKEVNRSADPVTIGIPEKAIEDAVKRALEAVKKAEAQGKNPREESAQKVKPQKSQGSIVAFYAAQPFEEAPEAPLPEGAPQIPENYYGMLSYTVVQALQQRQSPISYRDLARQVASRYRGTRGTRPPTPFAEGDLDREVLGLKEWPKRPDIILENDKGKLRLNAGELFGLTPGTILAVHPPAGDARDAKEVLGHVRIESAAPTMASVKPCAFAGKPVVPAESFKELSRCSIVQRDMGDMRVKVFLEDSKAVRATFEKMADEVKEMLTVVQKQDQAEWILRRMTPQQAKEEFGLTEKEDRVYLLQGQGRPRNVPSEKQVAERLKATGRPLPRKVFGRYDVRDEKALRGDLERDLPKLFKWQNLWRIAASVGTQPDAETHDLVFEIAKLKNADDRSAGELLRDGVMRSGQDVVLRLRNDGIRDLWVTVLYLNANLGVEKIWSGSIKSGKAMRPIPATMEAKEGGTGLEGIIVFAIPTIVSREEPRFDFLEQDSLQPTEARKGLGDPDGAAKLQSPFGKLLSAAAFNRGTRDIVPRVSSTPAILSQSWVMVSEK